MSILLLAAEDMDLPRWAQTSAQLGLAALALWYLVRVHIPNMERRADAREAQSREDAVKRDERFIAALKESQAHCERSHA